MRCELIEMPFILQGFYARQLEIFHCSFSRQQLLVMGCEELKVDTRGHVYWLEDHLGLSHTHGPMSSSSRILKVVILSLFQASRVVCWLIIPSAQSDSVCASRARI